VRRKGEVDVLSDDDGCLGRYQGWSICYPAPSGGVLPLGGVAREAV